MVIVLLRFCKSVTLCVSYGCRISSIPMLRASHTSNHQSLYVVPAPTDWAPARASGTVPADPRGPAARSRRPHKFIKILILSFRTASVWVPQVLPGDGPGSHTTVNYNNKEDLVILQ